MKITVTATMLCDLCGGKFTEEAMEAICDFYTDCAPDIAPSVGDICISFCEISAEDYTADYGEDEDNLIARLDNGNVVVAY